MAGTPTGVTNQGLEAIINRTVVLPIARAAAAALTVAFEIRKADHQSRGENPSDDLIMEEIRKIYFEMMALTDTASSLAKAGASQKQKP